jgi:hypothetical protein
VLPGAENRVLRPVEPAIAASKAAVDAAGRKERAASAVSV